MDFVYNRCYWHNMPIDAHRRDKYKMKDFLNKHGDAVVYAIWIIAFIAIIIYGILSPYSSEPVPWGT